MPKGNSEGEIRQPRGQQRLLGSQSINRLLLCPVQETYPVARADLSKEVPICSRDLQDVRIATGCLRVSEKQETPPTRRKLQRTEKDR
tara:strand:- start:47 stop:310 length:264 start_codon:yes stop_codon:yes gene_type:complete